MPIEGQNFSIPAGDASVVEFDIEQDFPSGFPDNYAVQWRVWDATYGNPSGTPIILKDLTTGITVFLSPPTVLVPIFAMDTLLATGNYWHQLRLTDPGGNRSVLASGVMTILLSDDDIPEHVATPPVVHLFTLNADGVASAMFTAPMHPAFFNADGTSAAPFVGAGAVPLVLFPVSVHLTVTSGQVIATLSALNSPTSWTITGGNLPGYFAISNLGALSITSAGATALNALSQNTTFNITVVATNSDGTSDPVDVQILVTT